MDGHIESNRTATILAFPAGGRRELARRRAVAAIENDNRPALHVDLDGWYHDAAMAEEKPN